MIYCYCFVSGKPAAAPALAPAPAGKGNAAPQSPAQTLKGGSASIWGLFCLCFTCLLLFLMTG
jgi:hypothetical protein